MLLTLLGCYSVLCGGGCVYQRRLIYFPTRLDSASAQRLAATEGFLPWRDGSGETIGWRLPAKFSSAGSVLIVHGNAGCALNRDYLATPIHDSRAVDVYVLEYPGYGARPGTPSERSLVAAATEAFDLLPLNLPKYVVSESLGTGVAAYLAKVRGDKVSGFLMFVPYDNFVSLA